jgi:hypothetical protein
LLQLLALSFRIRTFHNLQDWTGIPQAAAARNMGCAPPIGNRKNGMGSVATREPVHSETYSCRLIANQAQGSPEK